MCVKIRYPKNPWTSPNVQEDQIAGLVEGDRCATISFHGYLRSGNEGGDGHTIWLRLKTSVSFWDRTSHFSFMKLLTDLN